MNHKFLTQRTETGFAVLSEGVQITRADLKYSTARLIMSAPDLLRESQLLLARLQMMAIHPSHYADLAHAVRRAAPRTPKGE